MIFAYTLSIVLFILGIANMGDNSTLGWAFLVGAIILPLTTTVSLYPIFALSNIEDALGNLTQELRQLSKNEEKRTEQNRHPVQAISSPSPSQKVSQRMSKTTATFETTEDVMEYLNSRYHLTLSSADDLNTLKSKIANIADTNFGTLILQQKIADATTIEQAYSILALHKAARAPFH